MRKMKLIALLTLAAALALAFGIHAAGAESDFTYEIVDDEAVITGYTGEETYIQFPDMIGDCPVTAIDGLISDAQRAAAMEGVGLPDTLTRIGASVFANWSAMEYIRLPNHLVSIGENAFSGCASLKTAIIPDSVTQIAASAFTGCGTDLVFHVIKNSAAYQYAVQHGIETESYITYSASSAYPETSSPASADHQIWTYVHPESADYLRIVFSDDSHLAEGDKLLFGWDDEDLTAFHTRTSYYGDQLGGLVVLAYNTETFQIRLDSRENSSDSYFRVTGISAITQDEYRTPSFLIKNGIITAVSADAFNGNDSEDPLIVPGVVNGQTVTGIGPRAFASFIYGSSIRLPDSITTIGAHAFDDCFNLSSITLPGQLKVIGNGAFAYTWLTGELTLPDGLESIGNEAFACIDPLVSVTVPASVTHIGENAFATEDYDDTPVTLKVVEGSYAHQYAIDNGLSFTVLAPQEYTYEIVDGEAVITGYTGHDTDIAVPALIDGYPVTAIRSLGSQPDHPLPLTSVIVPEGVIRLEAHSLAYCPELSHVQLPDSLTTIGDSAFASCDSLTSIDIPSGVTSIGEGAFCNCTQLESLTLPAHVTEIGQTAFQFCDSLTSVTFPAGLRRIGAAAFNGAAQLESVFFHGACASVPDIVIEDGNGVLKCAVWHCADGDYTFSDGGTCGEGLSWHYDNRTLTITGAGAMDDYSPASGLAPWNAYASGITTLVVGEGITDIGDYAFYRLESLRQVSLPSTLTDIGNDAFWYCQALESIDLPAGIGRIGNDAFGLCYSLVDVVLPPSLCELGSEAFYSCASLTGVSIPETVTAIGADAFAYCGDGLTLTVTEGSYAHQYAIDNCLNFETIAAITPEFSYDVVDGCAFLTHYNGSDAEVTIPAELGGYPVTHISFDAFGFNETITSVIIPEGVQSISDYVFDTCTNLHRVSLPASIQAIHYNAFIDSPIQTVVYGGSIADISHIVNEASERPLLNDWRNSLAYASWSCSDGVYQPSAFSDTLSEDLSWSYDLNHHTLSISGTGPMPDMEQGSWPWSNCKIEKDVLSVVVESGVTYIGDVPFVGCDALERIIIPASVQSISATAFEGCPDTLTLTVTEGSYAHQYAIDNGLPFELTGGSGVQMLLRDDVTGETVRDSVHRTYYGVYGCFSVEQAPVVSIANADEIARDTQPVFTWEQIAGGEDSVWFSFDHATLTLDMDVYGDNDFCADFGYRFTVTWDDLDPVSFDLYIQLKTPGGGAPDRVALSPDTVDIVAGQSFTVTASWLPTGWDIEGVESTIDYDCNGDDPFTDVRMEGTTLTATAPTPGYYPVWVYLYTSLINEPGKLWLTVRNPDGSLPVLTPEIQSSPDEMQAAAGVAENPYYYDSVGNYVGSIALDNYPFFERFGQSAQRLVIDKVEPDAPDLTAVWDTVSNTQYDLYLGEPDTIIPADAVGDWHYQWTLWWDEASVTMDAHLVVTPAPVVFTLPADLTVIEAEAFQGVPADVFVIPASVTSIDSSAFSPGVSLRVVEGSYAQRFADEYGFDYLFIE